MNESTDSLTEQLANLQRQVFTLLLALVIVSGTLVVFLYYQSHVLNRDIANLQMQTKPAVDWVTINQAGVEKFKSELVTYSKTHPEFLPVLEKYGYVPPAKAKK